LIGTGGGLVNAVRNLQVPKPVRNFFTSWGLISFSGRNLLYAVSYINELATAWQACASHVASSRYQWLMTSHSGFACLKWSSLDIHSTFVIVTVITQ
jgi:hypothetical protein